MRLDVFKMPVLRIKNWSFLWISQALCPIFSSFCSCSSPWLLCLCDLPHLACLAVCSPVSKLLHLWGRAVWLAVLQSFPASFVCSPGPSPSLRALRLFSIHFQAGTKMGHSAARTWAPPRRPAWIEYSSGTGCSCGDQTVTNPKYWHSVQGRKMSTVTQFYLAFRFVCCLCS